MFHDSDKKRRLIKIGMAVLAALLVIACVVLYILDPFRVPSPPAGTDDQQTTGTADSTGSEETGGDNSEGSVGDSIQNTDDGNNNSGGNSGGNGGNSGGNGGNSGGNGGNSGGNGGNSGGNGDDQTKQEPTISGDKVDSSVFDDDNNKNENSNPTVDTGKSDVTEETVDNSGTVGGDNIGGNNGNDNTGGGSGGGSNSGGSGSGGSGVQDNFDVIDNKNDGFSGGVPF